jgi:hypothetical protein
VSEYQYYEFLALDQPLDHVQLAEVQALSTRARITATSFVNTYHWGSFRGNPRRMVEKYYDAHLYVTNWGTRQVMFRLPRATLGTEAVEPYVLDEEDVSFWTTADHLVLDLRSEDESGELEEGAEDALRSIVGVRAELAGGDFRALYLAWLSSLSRWEQEEDDEDEFRSVVEPPVPAGLAALSAPQRALADFLRVDGDLLAAAAEASAVSGASPPPTVQRLASLVEALPDGDKHAFLLRLALGREPGLSAELRRRLLPAPAPDVVPGQRSAAELLDAAYARREARHQASLRQAAEEAARREAARDRRLAVVAGQGEVAWKRVDDLIAAKKAVDYDQAATLLEDLHVISVRAGQEGVFQARLRDLRKRHQGKPALMRRLASSELP